MAKRFTKWDIPHKTLGLKFLEFLAQKGASRWVHLERLVELDNRKSRSARTGKVLKNYMNRRLIQKDPETRRYLITNEGKKELALRKAGSLLAASAPYYFNKELPFISFGDELTDDEQRQIAEVFRNHPRLRFISCIVKGKIETPETVNTSK